MKWFFWLVRTLLFVPQPRITQVEALEIAHRECERQGWGFRNPHITEELKSWSIWTMGGMRPSPYVVVDQQTGEVVRSGCGPR
jgi:hypothetical protein